MFEIETLRNVVPDISTYSPISMRSGFMRIHEKFECPRHAVQLIRMQKTNINIYILHVLPLTDFFFGDS